MIHQIRLKGTSIYNINITFIDIKQSRRTPEQIVTNANHMLK